MRRLGLLTFLALALAAGVGLALEAAADERDLAFTLGLVPFQVAAKISPGQEACQVPLVVEERFAAIRFQVTGSRWPGGSVAASVRTVPEGRVLARGRVRGATRNDEPTVTLDREVREDARVAVCLRNTGPRRLTLHGRAGAAKLGSRVEVDGAPKRADLTLVFLRAEPRSALSLVPEMFRRAALFRPAWVGPWTFWLLLVVVLCGVPALLAAALRSAEEPLQGEGRT